MPLKAGHDDEDFIDTCSSSKCDRIGIWYHKGKAYCDYHWGYKRRAYAFFERNCAAGKCRCGREKESAEKALCSNCENRLDGLRDKYEENGLCLRCGKQPRDGTTYCTGCKESEKHRFRSRRSKEKQIA